MTKSTALYRHFDANGVLLYVGVSLSAVTRLSRHAASSQWAESISRVSIEWFPTRHTALMAEWVAIHDEKPMYNLQRNANPPKDFGVKPRSLERCEGPASDIINYLGGRDAVAALVNVKQRAVGMAETSGKLPCAWFDALEMAARRPLPREAFTFRDRTQA